MRFHTRGGEIRPFHPDDFITASLRTLHHTVGTWGSIALLRTGCFAVTVLTLAAIARVMWDLPAAADAAIGSAAALIWTFWLEHQEVR